MRIPMSWSSYHKLAKIAINNNTTMDVVLQGYIRCIANHMETLPFDDYDNILGNPRSDTQTYEPPQDTSTYDIQAHDTPKRKRRKRGGKKHKKKR